MKAWRLAIPLALAMASPAYASDWWIVLARDAEGNVHFGESSQLRRTGNVVTFWAHIFYRHPLDNVKSARIQYEVNCTTYSIRERRYLDFDVGHQVIGDGDNSDSDPGREIAPDTSGAKYVEFACATPIYRHDHFLSIDPTVDLFTLADFYLDPRPIVPIPDQPQGH